MATLPVQQISLSGLEATHDAVEAGGDRFVPGSDIVLHFVNGGDQTIVTIATTFSVGELDLDDVVVTIAPNESQFVGPFQRQYFAASDGLADMTYSNPNTLTVAVLRL